VTPVRSVDLHIDVTEAAGLGEPAHIALTVTAPDTLREAPVVCFAKPGAGYSRGYYTEDLPGPGLGAQAAWHAERGWIVVSVDHLGVGESSLHNPEGLTFAPVIAAADAAEAEVRQRLAAGTLMDGLDPVPDAVTIGIGQSMGGAFTIVQQGRHHGYDGVAILGYSPLRTQPPAAPGGPPLTFPWVPRDTQLSEGVFTNGPALAEAAERSGAEPAVGLPPDAQPMAWPFHYDDVDPAVVRRDMEDYPARHGDLPPWASATIPGTAVMWCLAPGSTLAEAAAIREPVLVALGERDVLVDPRGEPRAYESAASVDLFICPRMAHMHNFAGTRELFWRRIETWAEWVRAVRDAARSGAG
jgi:alpha-beta hydrolase superfamily lysophospholipase